MADIYAAQLNPGKLDVVTDWVAKRDWATELDLSANRSRQSPRTASTTPLAKWASRSTS